MSAQASVTELYRVPKGRTELQVAAEAVALLLQSKVIEPTPTSIRRACDAAGIPVHLVKQVFISASPIAPFDSTDVADPIPLRPQYSDRYWGGVKVANDRRRAAKEPVPGFRLCSKCKELKPLDEFNFKNKRTLKRQSYCKLCANAYSAERRLTSEKVERLGAALRFVLQDGDAHAGAECVDCGQPCCVGDEVLAADAVLRHASHFGSDEGSSCAPPRPS